MGLNLFRIICRSQRLQLDPLANTGVQVAGRVDDLCLVSCRDHPFKRLNAFDWQHLVLGHRPAQEIVLPLLELPGIPVDAGPLHRLGLIVPLREGIHKAVGRCVSRES